MSASALLQAMRAAAAAALHERPPRDGAAETAGAVDIIAGSLTLLARQLVQDAFGAGPPPAGTQPLDAAQSASEGSLVVIDEDSEGDDDDDDDDDGEDPQVASGAPRRPTACMHYQEARAQAVAQALIARGLALLDPRVHYYRLPSAGDGACLFTSLAMAISVYTQLSQRRQAPADAHDVPVARLNGHDSVTRACGQVLRQAIVAWYREFGAPVPESGHGGSWTRGDIIDLQLLGDGVASAPSPRRDADGDCLLLPAAAPAATPAGADVALLARNAQRRAYLLDMSRPHSFGGPAEYAALAYMLNFAVEVYDLREGSKLRLTDMVPHRDHDVAALLAHPTRRHPQPSAAAAHTVRLLHQDSFVDGRDQSHYTLLLTSDEYEGLVLACGPAALAHARPMLHT